jgi:hypothetical protein
MARAFTPITILPFTRAQKKHLVGLADDTAKPYTFPFNFSAEPPPEWEKLFLVAWYRDRGGACLPRFAGALLHVASTIEDLQNTLSSAKSLVDETNRKYLKVVQRNAEDEAARVDGIGVKRTAAQVMASTLDRLKF